QDVFFSSIHGEPAVSYPYFSGYADETGTGQGEGFNLNLPLAKGSDWQTYQPALDAVKRFGPDVLIISLGLDTFEGDPISHFRLTSSDFIRMGQEITWAGIKTLFVMEGGYMVDEIGINCVNVLVGYES
ncbi:histone deacetylase family protein, partial [Salmonella enterica]|nr:histone deacetylase family protein [Salmonella enterica]